MIDINKSAQSDWDYLGQFLPENWSDKMKELGLLKFGRKFSGAEGCQKLLRTMLIHISGNLSLRTTSAVAQKGGIAEISDVGILKRLKKSTSWFTWATNELLACMQTSLPGLEDFEKFNFRFVDASLIDEPGATGSKWRLHYSLNSSTLAPDEIKVGDYRRGEKLQNFSVKHGDVMIGDRAYGTKNSIYHAVSHKGHVLVRFSPHNLPLHSASGRPLQLRKLVRKLKIGEVGEYEVIVKTDDININGRVFVLKKTKSQTEEAQKKVCRKASKDGKRAGESTLEFAGYVMLFTTLPKIFEAHRAMSIYRYRWQIELVFKRLKSILCLAPLYKKSSEGMMGWLSGKLFVATLIEYIILCAESFFPWGYPLREYKRELSGD